MILIQQISNLDLEYINDIKECLKHNVLNPIIDAIVVFSSCKGFESKIKIDSKKVKYFEVEIDLFEMMKYGKRNSKDLVIYGTPFLKFGIDLKKIMNLDKDKVLKEDNCYYIFNKSLDIRNERNIEDILYGQKLYNRLNLQKMGYYIKGFQYSSHDWRVSNEYKDSKRKENKSPKKESIKLPEIVEKKTIPSKVGAEKIDVIIVSVNYNDFLIVSLERNLKIFDNITVVTSSSDFLCQKICDKFGVKCIVTDVMYDDNAIFNKGNAINAGIKSIQNPDYILLLDADIVVMNEIDLNSLEDNILYTSDRYIVPDYDSYKKYISGDDKILRIEEDKGFGFFQLFSYTMATDYPNTSKDASKDDLVFRDRFDFRKKVESVVLHLGSDSNWKGRKSKSFINYKKFNNLLEKKVHEVKTFKICTFYYNPQKDIRKEKNFLKFISQFEGYEDNLFIGIVDYNDNPSIPENLIDNILLIKGDKDNIIWYKEILLNKMIEKIDTDYIIWMDCDLIYENLDWISDISSIVRGKDFVQLYGNINYLGTDGEILESHRSILSSKLSSNRKYIDSLLGEGYKPGGSWIGKTSILKEKKFFEKMYVGGGDTIFLYGLFGIDDGHTLKLVKKSNENIWKDAVEWINSHKKYKLGYLDVSVDHLYHGDLKDRNYDGRYHGLSFIESNLNKIEKIDIENNSILKRGLINRIFDKVYCLNLDRRIDRWNSMQKKTKDLGIEVKRFSAVDGDKIDAEILSKYSINKYAVGCIFSHYEIIKDAKRNNYKNILVIEDDVLFSDNFLEDFERKMAILNSWKMIYLGCSQYDWDVDIVDGFYRSKNSLGTFAYAIDQSLYDEILDTDCIKDTPIDNILSIIQNKHYGECYNFFPNIIIADVSESDIRGSREMIKHSKKMRWEIDKFKNKKPFFSIIIPTYNSKHLIETLNSIQYQTIDDYECIVVDDGSIDDLSEIENIYKNTKVYKRPDYLNKNANSCRNYGLYMSKGDYIIFLDSDDCLSSKCLEDRKSAISKNMSLDLHIFKMGRFKRNINDMNQLVNKKPLKDRIVDDFLSYNIIWPITAPAWKRESLYNIGGFDENLNRFQDYDIHIRFLLSNDSYIIYDDIDIDCYYRNSEFHTNLTEARKKVIIESAEYLIKKYEKYGVNFNVEFFQYLKRRYNYESNVHRL